MENLTSAQKVIVESLVNEFSKSNTPPSTSILGLSETIGAITEWNALKAGIEAKNKAFSDLLDQRVATDLVKIQAELEKSGVPIVAESREETKAHYKGLTLTQTNAAYKHSEHCVQIQYKVKTQSVYGGFGRNWINEAIGIEISSFGRPYLAVSTIDDLFADESFRQTWVSFVADTLKCK